MQLSMESVEFRNLTREERIRWHEKRVLRETPVFDFFDRINSGLEESDLRESLSKVRHTIQRVYDMMNLLKDREFTTLRTSHAMAVAILQSSIRARSDFLTKVLKTGPLVVGDNDYHRLEQREIAARDQVVRLDKAICMKAFEYNVPPDQFMHFERETNAPVCSRPSW